MGHYSTQQRADIIKGFIAKYNAKWSEDWTVDMDTKSDRVDIYRKENSVSCDGHFLGKLTDFCREHFDAPPCAGYVFGRFQFYI